MCPVTYNDDDDDFFSCDAMNVIGHSLEISSNNIKSRSAFPIGFL